MSRGLFFGIGWLAIGIVGCGARTGIDASRTVSIAPEEAGPPDSGAADTCPSCNNPPPPECVGTTTARRYIRSGACRAGACSYVASDVVCPWACADGRCFDPNDVVELAAGLGHTCARRRSGAVACWGSNTTGQLGDASKMNRLAPGAVFSYLTHWRSRPEEIAHAFVQPGGAWRVGAGTEVVSSVTARRWFATCQPMSKGWWMRPLSQLPGTIHVRVALGGRDMGCQHTRRSRRRHHNGQDASCRGSRTERRPRDHRRSYSNTAGPHLRASRVRHGGVLGLQLPWAVG